MAQLIDSGMFSVIDTDSSLGVGWKVNVYQFNTSTRLASYPTEADAAAGTNANANPVILGADGRLPPMWINATAKVILTDENDVVKETIDPINANGFFGTPVWVEEYGAIGNDSTNDTTAIQRALDASLDVWFSSKTYKITASLTLRAGHRIHLAPGTTVKQYTIGQNAFVATSIANVWIFLNGGAIRGPGGWKKNADGSASAWTGNTSWNGWRGVEFAGCTDCGIIGPGRVYNWGNAQVSFVGGSSLRAVNLHLEGTHAYSEALAASDNFQQGVYISNDATYGGANHVFVDGCEISGVAQGILLEAQQGVAAPTGPRLITNCDFHDIPGQHGIYDQDQNITVGDCTFRNVELSAVKFQSADANRNIRSLNATGITAYNINNALFEMACIGSGSLEDVKLHGNGYDVGYLLTLNGKIIDLTADVNGTTISGQAVFAQGADMSRVTVDVDAADIQQDGILVSATASEMTFRPRLRNANMSATSGGSGVRIATSSATTTVILENPYIVDAQGTPEMQYGVYHSTAGSIVKIRGSITATAATDYAVRATGKITEFPTEATLSGTTGQYLSLANIRSSQARKFTLTTTTSSPAVLWNQELEDEKAYLVTANLVGRLDGSAQRAAYTKSVLVYRDGGSATIEGSIDTDVTVASGSFAGVNTLDVSGNEVRLMVDSGGSTTYHWAARVKVEEV